MKTPTHAEDKRGTAERTVMVKVLPEESLIEVAVRPRGQLDRDLGSNVEEAWAVRGYVDYHRHLPHGADGRTLDELARTRESAVQAATDEGVDYVRDMGLGRLIPWRDKPAGVISALRGVEGSVRPFAQRFAVTSTSSDIALRIQEAVAAGADMAKLFVNRSGRLPRAEALEPVMSRDQIDRAVEYAREQDLPLVAHCHGGRALRDCVDAGVDRIEHGLYVEREELIAMREAGVGLTLTIGVYLKHVDGIAPRIRQLVRDTIDTGVSFAVGTDGTTMPGEVIQLVEHGMPFQLAIKAATELPAEATGVDRRLILFGSDPASHPHVLTQSAGFVRLPPGQSIRPPNLQDVSDTFDPSGRQLHEN